ncbi:YtxH domain-containing protein, partial [Staphylococcus borealis]
MKVSRVLFGITVGVASGIAVSWLNRDDQSVKNNTIDAKEPTGSRSELEHEIASLKRNF